MFWFLMAALSLAALAVALWPALRRGPAEPTAREQHQALYRRELDDLARDRALGLIAEADSAASRHEIERRLLRLQAAAPPQVTERRPRGQVAILATILLLAPLLAAALYLKNGRPDLAATTPNDANAQAAAIAALPPAERLAQIKAMVDGLEARLNAAPPDAAPDFDGWMRLGLSRNQLGDNAAAARAFSRAVAINPQSADASAMLGLSLAAASGAKGALPPDARGHLEKALALDADQAEALWYLGLHEAASGNKAPALKHWQRLLAGLDPEGPDYATVAGAIDALQASADNAGERAKPKAP